MKHKIEFWSNTLSEPIDIGTLIDSIDYNILDFDNFDGIDEKGKPCIKLLKEVEEIIQENSIKETAKAILQYRSEYEFYPPSELLEHQLIHFIEKAQNYHYFLEAIIKGSIIDLALTNNKVWSEIIKPLKNKYSSCNTNVSLFADNEDSEIDQLTDDKLAIINELINILDFDKLHSIRTRFIKNFKTYILYIYLRYREYSEKSDNVLFSVFILNSQSIDNYYQNNGDFIIDEPDSSTEYITQNIITEESEESPIEKIYWSDNKTRVDKQAVDLRKNTKLFALLVALKELGYIHTGNDNGLFSGIPDIIKNNFRVLNNKRNEKYTTLSKDDLSRIAQYFKVPDEEKKDGVQRTYSKFMLKNEVSKIIEELSSFDFNHADVSQKK